MSGEAVAAVFRGEWDGLRHDCRDPGCHVTAFVETLRLMRDGLDPEIAETIRVAPRDSEPTS